MNIVIESPHASLIFGPLDTLSPPPTPVAKRARHFFPNVAGTPAPVFFPTSHSLLSGRGSGSCETFGASSRSAPAAGPPDEENAARQALARLAHIPVPRLKLRPRPATRRVAPGRLRIDPWSSFGPGADQEVEYFSSREIFPKSYVKGTAGADEIPPLPFVFDEDNERTAEAPAPPPALAPSTGAPMTSSIPKLPDMSNSTDSTPKTLPIVATSQAALSSGRTKLLPFEQGGMRPQTVKKRHSFAARSA